MTHRLLITGAGRIGAAFNWHDDSYTHAGAALALKDRVELVGFVEKDKERAEAAKEKWKVSVWSSMGEGLEATGADIVSVCTPPEHHGVAVNWLVDHSEVEGIWVEKPFRLGVYRARPPWIQVNYLRRACPNHRKIAALGHSGTLTVTAKDDIHTRCHFEDLAKWWRATLVYHAIPEGPCSYTYLVDDYQYQFPNGGVNPGECMKGMLGNLMDAMEGGSELWSPAA